MMPTIRVAERTGRLEALKDNRFSADYEDELERVLRGLFNACPDCTSDAWEEVAENFDDQIGRDKAAVLNWAEDRDSTVATGRRAVVWRRPKFPEGQPRWGKSGRW
jgi:hypothetical protein